jgi:AraC-like DNA-binding protein
VVKALEAAVTSAERGNAIEVREGLHPARVDLRALMAQAQGRPVGFFACNDDTGCAVLQRCLATGISVPERACVLGVGNEDIVLVRSPVPLSSIELPAYGIGATAVEMLLEWRTHPQVRPADRVLPPLRVVHRNTTGACGIGDPCVRDALGLIREAAGKKLSVGDVVRNLGKVARRTLEEKFRRATGRSIGEEIRGARVARAKELLAAPALSIKEVACLSAFSSPQKFSGVFRQEEGCSPREFRRLSGAEMPRAAEAAPR